MGMGALLIQGKTTIPMGFVKTKIHPVLIFKNSTHDSIHDYLNAFHRGFSDSCLTSSFNVFVCSSTIIDLDCPIKVSKKALLSNFLRIFSFLLSGTSFVSFSMVFCWFLTALNSWTTPLVAIFVSNLSLSFSKILGFTLIDERSTFWKGKLFYFI